MSVESFGQRNVEQNRAYHCIGLRNFQGYAGAFRKFLPLFGFGFTCFIPWDKVRTVLLFWKYIWFPFSAKSLSDLVNESLNLNEETAVAALSTLTSAPSGGGGDEGGSGRLSPTPPPLPAPNNTQQGQKLLEALAAEASSAAAATAAGGSTPLSSRRKAVLGGPPPEKLVSITNSMNSHLTSLLVST